MRFAWARPARQTARRGKATAGRARARARGWCAALRPPTACAPFGPTSETTSPRRISNAGISSTRAPPRLTIRSRATSRRPTRASLPSALMLLNGCQDEVHHVHQRQQDEAERERQAVVALAGLGHGGGGQHARRALQIA